MAVGKLSCPSCGETVYATDAVCMSCGAQLQKPGTAAPPPPQPAPRGGPPVPPGPGVPRIAGAPLPPGAPPMPPRGRRPARQVANPPFYHRIVEGLGGFWEIFPFLGVALNIGLRLAGMSDEPGALFLLLLVADFVWLGLYLLWVIFDIMYYGANWGWAIAAIVCYPIGLVIYLSKGRQSSWS